MGLAASSLRCGAAALGGVSVLFGILAMVFRFVPYIGAFIAAIFPIALAVAVDPGWSMALMTTALAAALRTCDIRSSESAGKLLTQR